MIIDCHAHIGRKRIESTPIELLHSMDKAGIDKSFVFASRVGDAPNEWMLEQISPYKDRLIGVAAAPDINIVDLNFIPKMIDWYGEGKIVAVKFYTGYEHYYPADRWDVLSHLQAIGCPAIFHSGDCLNTACGAKLKYAHPLHIDEAAVDYPNLNFIIAHMGFPWHRDAAEVCFKNENVYSDISGFVYGEFTQPDKLKFKKVINEFMDIAPSNKLLFGTDWPISDQYSYVDVLDTEYGELLGAQALTKNVQKAFKL